MEEYREIKGYERYSISNYGNVINNHTGKKLSQRISTNGYMRVNLRKGNILYEKPKTLAVHRLVAEAFIPIVQGKDYINHIDGDKQNNAVYNLEWCTASENTTHALKYGLMNPDYSEMNRLSYFQSRESHRTKNYREKMQQINQEKGITRPVIQINRSTGQIINRFNNCYEAARFLFPVSNNKDRLISRCARGKCKSAYNFKWAYEGGDLTL